MHVRSCVAVTVLAATCAFASNIAGTVRDAGGAAIPGAAVTLSAEGVVKHQAADPHGRFLFRDVNVVSATLTATAEGFSPATLDWQAGMASADFVLQVKPAAEQITVSATRVESKIEDTPSTVVVLGTQDLLTQASPTLDGTLRQVPGFALFRRSDSRTANPTSQGVSLRGMGASGSSRALVLEDGVPLNDPFGGWIYWSRVPKVAVERVEVGEGGLSDLYGGAALGGVVNVITRRPRDSFLTLEGYGANQLTGNGSGLGSLRRGKWVGTVLVDAFRTDGYIPVDPAERGSVDNTANSRHLHGALGLERLFSHGEAWLRGELFGEDRHNGTILEVNDSTIRQLSTGVQWDSATAGSFNLAAYGSTQNYHQTFASIGADRNSETLARVQHVPADQAGFSAQWSRALGKWNTIVAGADFRRVQGFSDDVVYAASQPSTWVDAGGVQRTIGIFGEDLIRAGGWTFILAGRVDTWNNVGASNRQGSFQAPGVATDTAFPDRSENAFSPRLSVMRQLRTGVAVTASGYRAFRPPTLNELYRTFRLGNVVTLANQDLRAERLTGGEAGLLLTPWMRRVSLRPVFFWADVARPVTNLTLSSTPALITRQRYNLGRTRSRGLEIEAEAQVTPRIAAGAGYQYAQATVVQSPVDPALIGLWVSQVPRHVVTMNVRAGDIHGFTFAADARRVGLQFDDDRNQFPLDPFFALNLYAARRMSRQVEIFAAVENATNERFTIGRTPVRTLGSPVLAQIGLRLTLGEPSGH
ncbi:MAG TPA: TonB-dependent receptor [Terriglobales bacterium]|nr:TonB-dependent receptor [Terriglobales bacterium]